MTGRRSWLVVYLAAALPAVVMAVTQPMWSRTDEPQHADYLAQLAAGVWPREGETMIRPEIYHLMQETGVYGGALPGEAPVPVWLSPPPGLGGGHRLSFMSRHVWQYSYEALQPPLFYLLAVPLWTLAQVLLGAKGAVFAIRIANGLLVALVGPMTLAIARNCRPGVRAVPGVAVAFAAFGPGLLATATAITNDTLATVLGTVCLLIATHAVTTRWTARAALVAGLVLGFAIVTKLTAAGIAPGLLLALCLDPAGATPALSVLRRAAVFTAGAAAPLACWFGLNIAVYGTLTTAAAAHSLAALPPPSVTPAWVLGGLIHEFATFWTGEPAFSLAAAAPVTIVLALAAILAAVGLVRAANRPVLVLAVAAAGAGLLGLVTPELASSAFLPPGRYAYPAVGAVAVLLAVGLSAEVGTRAALVAGAAFVLSSTVLFVERDLDRGAASRPAAPPADFRTVDARTAAAGLAIALTGYAVEPGGRAVWLRLEVHDSAPEAVEWTPTPVMTSGGATVGLTDYPASSHLPVIVRPGESSTGWIRLRTDPSALRRPLKVRFDAVATVDYSEVETAVLPIEIER